MEDQQSKRKQVPGEEEDERVSKGARWAAKKAAAEEAAKAAMAALEEEAKAVVSEFDWKLMISEGSGVMREAVEDRVRSEWQTWPEEVKKHFAYLNLEPVVPVDVSRKAFDLEFQGDGPRRFVKALENILGSGEFARVVGLFQSSGWGKSRLVKELHREGVWVVYLSLGSGSCFPSPGEFANEFETSLRGHMKDEGLAGEVKCMNYCLAFWISCLRVVAELASSSSPEEFGKMMIGDRGEEFWPKVKDGMPGIVDSLLLPVPAGDRIVFLNEWDNAAATQYGLHTKEAWNELNKAWKKQEPKQKLKVLFVFDEARRLLPYRGQVDRKSPPENSCNSENLYIPLRRSTRAMRSSLVLFMDTTSRIANFLSPEWKDPSARNQKPSSGFFLAPPLFGFFQADLGRKQEASLGPKSLAGVAEERAMVGFGRPLWWSLFRASGSDLETVKSLAMLKLTSHGSPDQVYSDEALIAIVGNRCSLSVDPSSTLATDLVAGHALTVLHVSPDRNRVYGTWPVEPLLSEAAYEAMTVIKSVSAKGYRFLLEPVVRKVSEGLVDVGEMGEFVTRLILIDAIDNARLKYGRAWIFVRELLDELFGGEVVEGMIKSAAGYHKANLDKLLKGKLIVNAFHRLYKQSQEMTDDDALLAMSGRCGIVASRGEWGHDFILPVHLGAESEPLKPDTAILLQSKTEEKTSTGLLRLAKPSPQYSGLTFIKPGTPYLSLFANVGLVGKKKLVQLVPSHRVWKSIACSTKQAIVHARKALGPETMVELWKRYDEQVQAVAADNVEAAAEAEDNAEQAVAEEEEEEEEEDEETADNVGREWWRAKIEADAQRKSKVENEAHRRWRAWMEADCSNQIILRAVGLNSFELKPELREMVECMLRIKVNASTMRELNASKSEEKARFDIVRENWKLQEEMLDGMFILNNISQLQPRRW